jgi:flagellar hook-length control protein FliK
MESAQASPTAEAPVAHEAEVASNADQSGPGSDDAVGTAAVLEVSTSAGLAPALQPPVADPSGLLFASPPTPIGPHAVGPAQPASIPGPAELQSRPITTSVASPDSLPALLHPTMEAAFNDAAGTSGDQGPADGRDGQRQGTSSTFLVGQSASQNEDGPGAAAVDPAQTANSTSPQRDAASLSQSVQGQTTNAAVRVNERPFASSRDPNVEATTTPGAGKEGVQLAPAAREALAPLLDAATRGGAATAAPSDSAQPTTKDEQPTTPLVTRGLAALAKQRGGTLAMRLDPPGLGDLRITMTVVNGRVSAELVTSNSQAHALLSSDLTSLRQSLEAQGLAVDRLSIQSAPLQSNGVAHRHDGSLPSPGSGAQPAPNAPSQPQQQGNSDGQDRGSDRQQQQRHDAGHGQSRGRSSDSGERDSGSRSRRRANFARVFNSTTLP